jgi:hypothetical protein
VSHALLLSYFLLSEYVLLNCIQIWLCPWNNRANGESPQRQEFNLLPSSSRSIVTTRLECFCIYFINLCSCTVVIRTRAIPKNLSWTADRRFQTICLFKPTSARWRRLKIFRSHLAPSNRCNGRELACMMIIMVLS